MTKAGNAIDGPTIDRTAATDANQLGTFYAWVKRRLIQWNQNCPDAATMTALGYSDPAAQAEILQLQANFNALMQLFEGTDTAAYAHSMIDDLAKLQGLG